MENQNICAQNKRYRNPKIWVDAERLIEVIQRKE